MNKLIEATAPPVVLDYLRQQEERRRPESSVRRLLIEQLKECAQGIYDAAILVDADHLACEVPLDLIQSLGRAIRALEITA